MIKLLKSIFLIFTGSWNLRGGGYLTHKFLKLKKDLIIFMLEFKISKIRCLLYLHAPVFTRKGSLQFVNYALFEELHTYTVPKPYLNST